MTAEIIETPNEVLSIHSFCDSCQGTICYRKYDTFKKLWYTLHYSEIIKKYSFSQKYNVIVLII